MSCLTFCEIPYGLRRATLEGCVITRVGVITELSSEKAFFTSALLFKLRILCCLTIFTTALVGNNPLPQRGSFHPPKLCKLMQFKCLKRTSCSCTFILNVSTQSKSYKEQKLFVIRRDQISDWSDYTELENPRVFLSHISQNVYQILDLFTEPGWFLASLK